MGYGYKPGDEPIPGYRLIRFLGRGNFGEVWMAASPGNAKVALKIIDLRGKEGVLESRAIQRMKDIHQAHLVSISAFWLINSGGQIIEDASISNLTAASSAGTDIAPNLAGTMCLADGQQLQPVELIVAMTLGSKNLSDLLEEYEKQEKKGIPVNELLDYMEDAAKGLDYLNAPRHDDGRGPKPIIHGDVKPQNLLIVGDSLQICDFGLAREIDDLRKTTTAMGTYAYAAPELLAGHPHVHSDQYCLAVSYIELRTGKLPLFGESSILKIVEMHRYGKLDFSGLGPSETEVLRKAAHPDPKQRYGTCRVMVRDLRQAVADDGGGGGKGLRKGKRYIGLGALALLSAALFAAGAWMVHEYAGHGFSPPHEVWLPKDCSAAVDSAVELAGSKRLYNRIVCQRDGVSVPFILVKKVRPGDPETFYVMENKVWNGLYQKFAATSSRSLTGSGPRKDRSNAAIAADVEKDHLPKMMVTCDDAFQFAKWLGGTLPTTAQWDKAAGLSDDANGLGPFKGPWPQPSGSIAVGLQRPMAVGTATADVSFFGCRDMSGNGQEWTRDSKNASIKLPPERPSDDPPVRLRGRDYHRSTPLLFQEIKDPETYDEVDSFLKSSEIIGFRVVIDQIPP